MFRKTFFVLIALTVLVMLASSHVRAREKKESLKAVDLQITMRDLWMDHIFWIRSLVLATKYSDNDAAKVAEDRIVKNAKDIAGAVAPFYGKDSGDKFFGLLIGHYDAIKDYLAAAIAGNKEGKVLALGKLKKNADEIATFLSSANPENWPKDMLLSLLIAHSGHHIEQIDEVVAKDYGAEAATWEAMKNHVYTIADDLAGGIERQFSKKF